VSKSDMSIALQFQRWPKHCCSGCAYHLPEGFQTTYAFPRARHLKANQHLLQQSQLQFYISNLPGKTAAT